MPSFLMMERTACRLVLCCLDLPPSPEITEHPQSEHNHTDSKATHTPYSNTTQLQQGTQHTILNHNTIAARAPTHHPQSQHTDSMATHTPSSITAQPQQGNPHTIHSHNTLTAWQPTHHPQSQQGNPHTIRSHNTLTAWQPHTPVSYTHLTLPTMAVV